MHKLFGTDGVRGVAGEYPLDDKTVFALGVALGDIASRHAPDPESGDRDGYARIRAVDRGQVAGGLASRGVRVRFAGVTTTPGVAYLTRTDDFVAGVMISASHNPYQDNGIKVFGHSGYKLPDDEEHAIEQEIFRLLDAGVDPGPAGAYASIRAWTAATWTICLHRRPLLRGAANGARLRQRRRLRDWRRSCSAAGRRGASRSARSRTAATSIWAAALSTWRRCASACSSEGADAGVAFDGDADRAIFVSRSRQDRRWRRRCC